MNATWDDAACKGRGELFFGPDGESGRAQRWRERQAKGICMRCPVISECFTYAVGAGIDTGVWGGSGEAERRERIRQDARRLAIANERAAILAAGEKTCTGCGVHKPLDDYYPLRDWYGPQCKACVCRTAADWAKRNKAA